MNGIGDDGPVDMNGALRSEPIGGVERVGLDHLCPGAVAPKALSTPQGMTASQWEKRKLTHLPSHPGSTICKGTRRLTAMHHPSHEHLRAVPLLVADYCCMRVVDEMEVQPNLVMMLYPSKLVFAHAVPRNRIELIAIRLNVNFIRDAGVTHVACRSLRKESNCAVIDEAVSKFGGVRVKVVHMMVAMTMVCLSPRLKEMNPTHRPMHQLLFHRRARYRLCRNSLITANPPPIGLPKGPSGPSKTSPGPSSPRCRHTFVFPSRCNILLPVGLCTTTCICLTRINVGEAAVPPTAVFTAGRSMRSYVRRGGKVVRFVPKRLRAKAGKPLRYGVFLGRALGSGQRMIGLIGVTWPVPEQWFAWSPNLVGILTA